MQNKQGEKGCEIEGGGQNTYGYNNGWWQEKKISAQ